MNCKKLLYVVLPLLVSSVAWASPYCPTRDEIKNNNLQGFVAYKVEKVGNNEEVAVALTPAELEQFEKNPPALNGAMWKAMPLSQWPDKQLATCWYGMNYYLGQDIPFSLSPNSTYWATRVARLLYTCDNLRCVFE